MRDPSAWFECACSLPLLVLNDFPKHQALIGAFPGGYLLNDVPSVARDSAFEDGSYRVLYFNNFSNWQDNSSIQLLVLDSDAWEEGFLHF